MRVTEAKKKEDRKKIDEDKLPHLADRDLTRFERKDAPTSGRAQMYGVEKFKDGGRFTKNLLVIGTGRCGTTWLSKTLVEAGFDVPHECVGDHGTVSMFFHTDHFWYPFLPWVTDHPGRKAHLGERLSDFEFDHVAHIVRHPLEFEASARSILNAMEYYWAQDCSVLTVPWNTRPTKLRNLFYWRDVVTQCEKMAAQTIALNRVKDNDRWWKTLTTEANLYTRGNVPSPPRLKPNNKSSGFKKHEPMSWAEVSSMDAELARDLKRMCRRLKLED